jgi:copper chaperone CopZ
MIRSMLFATALAATVGACSTESGESSPTPQPVETTGKSEPTTPKEEPVKTNTKALTFEMQISGMMCDGCTAAVTNIIQGVEGVESAQVDLKTGKAIVKAKPGAKVDEATLTAAVGRDYEVDSCKKVSN